VDPQGLMPQAVAGAIVGFVFSSISEVGGRMASGQPLSTAISNTLHDPVSVTNILTSTAMGALTAGASSLLTKGVTEVGKIAMTNIVVNTIGGSVDSTIKSIAENAITGQPQNFKETTISAGMGAASAFVFSGLTQGTIAASTTRSSQITNAVYGIETNIQINKPAWSGAAGIVGENVIPAIIDIVVTAEKGGKNH
jgi:hypothetical protein